jgi:MOSC domain-containing protein YiiM
VSDLLAVCTVASLHQDAGGVGVTAIDKQPVAGRVKLLDLGLYGDVQADRYDHGGADQALYAYADEQATYWAAELGREVLPGSFGENLRTAGLDVDGAEIGERWRIGEKVVVEVTSPRTPCQTFARWLGEQRWVRRFADHGYPGAYLRVVERGDVGAGDPIEVVHRPGHGVSVGGWFRDPTPYDARTLLEAHAAGTLVLSDAMVDVAGVVAARTPPP